MNFDADRAAAAIDLVAAELGAIGPMPPLRDYDREFNWMRATRPYVAVLQEALRRVPPFDQWRDAGVQTGNGSYGASPMVLAPDLVKLIAEHGPDFAKSAMSKVLTFTEATANCHTIAWGFEVEAEPLDLGDGLSVKMLDQEIANARHSEWSNVPWPYRGLQRPAVFTRSIRVSPLLHPIIDGEDFPVSHDAVAAVRDTEADIKALSVIGGSVAVVEESRVEFEDPHLRALFSRGKTTYFVDVVPLREIVPTRLDESAKLHLRRFRALSQIFRTHLLDVIDRLGSAKRRQSPTNQALDTCIALEMLMTGKGNEGAGITARIALRAALLLGDTLLERQDLRRSVNKVYGLRNKAAHGGSASTDPGDIAVVDQAIRTCDRVIRRVIETGGPVDWPLLELDPPPLKRDLTGEQDAQNVA